MNRRKAQAFMTDFMASIAIFGAILTLFITMWSLGVDSQQSFDSEDLLRSQAERTADFMVTTEGYPNNWEEAGVEVRIPGFATSQNVLSMEKIAAFGNLSYERQKQLTKTQNFTLEYRDPESGEILNYTDEESEEEAGGGGEEGAEVGNALGSEPIAYMVQSGTELSSLEMIDNLNESNREWHFYYPSEEDQDQLDSLTAENVYTNSGSGRDMMERMIADSADKGWNKFTIGDRIEVAGTSELADIDGDGSREVFYKDGDDRLNIYNLEDGSTRRIETVPEFARIGAVDDFTDSGGNELAYIDGNDQIAFYSFQDDEITETSEGAIDVGDAATVEGETTVFFIDGNNNLAYYSQENGVTETSVNGGRVGGAGDIDEDGNTEVAYLNGNDNLAFYDIADDSAEETSLQVTDTGWINGNSVAVIGSNNGNMGYWNYTESSFVNTDNQAAYVGDFTEVQGATSIIYTDTIRNQDLTAYDTQTGFKKYLRTGEQNDIRASDGGFEVDIPGYGQSFVYEDGSSYINFYIRSEDNTAHLRERVQYIGGAEDVDNDGAEELVYIDNDNRNLDYYDFEDGESVVAQEDGSNVRGKEIGVPGDVDNDGAVETPYMTSNDLLGYYDYEDNEVVEFNSLGQIETLGGTEDVDREGNQEIIYIADDRLHHYDPVDDDDVDTGEEASYAGGAADLEGDPQLEIMYRNSDQQITYYNTATGETTEETTRIRRSGSVTQLNEDDGYDGIATNQNSRLGYFDFSLSLNYNTVISENADVQPGSVENDAILREAVEEGMTYLHTRNDISMLTDTFGMDSQDPGSDTAEIQQVEPLLNSDEYSVGDEVPFSNVQTGFQNVDTVFANSTGDPAACMACMQEFGNGKVYYLAGLEAEGSPSQVSFGDVNESVASDEKPVETVTSSPFDVGLDSVPSSDTVIVVDRQVAVNRSGTLQQAELNYVVWR